MNKTGIGSPIEQRNTGKGNPNAIIHADRPLNNRQKDLLDRLPDYNSRLVVNKREVSMRDIAALTAYTGDEFAVFTKGKERLIIRGNSSMVEIDARSAKELADKGYRWSGHIHPGMSGNSLIASGGDILVLNQFPQERSVIYNSKGYYEVFEKE